MPRRYRPFLGSRSRDRFVALVVLVILFLLLRSSPSLTDGIDSQTHVEDRPRYLYHSPFRTNPDLEYERQLSDALIAIEREVSASHGNEDTADTLWQIMLKDRDARTQDSLQFEEKNSEWRYSLVTSDFADEFVKKTLASVPELARLYYAYPHFVLRGDLLRYLILWYFGGYYADIDVYPARSIKSCPSLRNSVFKETGVDPEISLVVGIEIDEPFASPQKMRDWHWVRRYGFLQYTMYAPRRFSPLLREVIIRVLSHTKRHLDQSSFIWGAKYNELTTLEITGPGVFTDAILDALSDTLPASHPLISGSVKADAGLGDLVPPSSGASEQRVTWAPFHGIKEPLCVDASDAKKGKRMGGLCALPVNAWGNGQRHSGSEPFNSIHACINHRFKGTWKPWKQGWKKRYFG
ncbi:hypothetical protein NUU61_000071 [Penicillium alfredii]|uniref:Alpha-1,6-mannosyltransferase n=1 Tax=Penicillium alfredii TaxID=1506179 RepID=A0A9W9G979_9EURO|nr:uncharacterized protein NUU61_000071 [Penicillium alfredii]KAJ5114312.1 hypothetical protein NUU61_000071 [Penicillium alfredii]